MPSLGSNKLQHQCLGRIRHRPHSLIKASSVTAQGLDPRIRGQPQLASKLMLASQPCRVEINSVVLQILDTKRAVHGHWHGL